MGGGNYLRDAPENVICSYQESILKSCLALDAEKSSKIILPTQNLERAC